MPNADETPEDQPSHQSIEPTLLHETPASRPADDLASTIVPDPLVTDVSQSTLQALSKSPDPYQTISLVTGPSAIDQEIESLCQRFEAASRDTGKATIEDFMPGHITGVNRSRLLERLVMLEIWRLRETKSDLDTTQYLSRFSQHEDAVRSALRRLEHIELGGTVDFLPTPVSNAGTSVRPGSTKPKELTRFHPIKLHAKGGLGAVFLARDAELGRTVALKEIQSKHSLDRSSQDRFVTEAIVTGALEHPGIVPVYGLGRYSDGRPYYAMRFIQGRSFQEAIRDFHKAYPHKDSRAYSSREFKALLRTFIEMCSAMYYAHEHGILHRDIKPDNVMMGKFGETMVVDWGLAKVLGKREDANRKEFDNLALRKLDGETMVGAVMGTPAYMSPEQASGVQDELTPASDIYSLGATLFTLLTGERPIDGKSSIEVILNVRKGNVRPIDTIAPKVPAALVSICRKAMHVTPSERYANAGELVEDIERWLADDLVLAHQHAELPIERLGRLVRRYHTWAIAGAIFLTAFTVLSIIAVILIERSRSREVLAKLQAQESKAEAIKRYQESRTAIDTWLVGSNDALQFYPGMQSLRKRMLQLAVDDYESLATSSSRDPDLELERARTLIRLGDLHQIQQDYERAQEDYEAARSALGAIGDNAAIHDARDAELANTHARSAVAFYLADKLEEAESHYKTAIASFDEILKRAGISDTVLPYAHAAFIGYGELLIRKGKYEDAIGQFKRCLGSEDNATVAGKDAGGPDRDERGSKAMRLNQMRAGELLGRAYTAIGKHEEADAAILNAITTLTSSQAENTDDPNLVDAIASLQVSRADVMRVRGLQSETERCLLMAAEKYRQLLDAMPDVPRYAENLALTLTDLGLAIQDDGNSQKAMTILNEAAANWQDLLALYAEVPRYHEESAACEDALAQVVLDATNDAEQALGHASSAVQTYQELLELNPESPSYRHRLAVARSHAAVNLQQLGRSDDALLVFEAAEQDLRSLAEQFTDSPVYRHALAHVLEHRGTCLFDTGRGDESKPVFEDAITIWKQLANEGHVEAASDLVGVLTTCPIVELNDVDSALLFAAKAHDASPANARYKATHAVAIALKGDDNARAETLLNELKAERGEWTAQEFFAMALLNSHAADEPARKELANDFLTKGETWRLANRPGSRNLMRLQALASQRANGQ